MFGEDRFSNEIPEMEVLRDFVPFEHGHKIADNMDQDEPGGKTPIKKGNLSLSPQRVLASEGEPVLEHSIQSVGSVEPAVFNLGAISGHARSELKLQPTPQIEKKKETTRKRKHLFDGSLVLTNEFIKMQLKDSRRLLCKRKRWSCTTLDSWRFHYMTSKDRLFSEPLVTGMCTDLQEAFKKSTPVCSVVDVSHGFLEIDQLQAGVGGTFSEVVSPLRANDFTSFSAGAMQSPTRSQNFASAEVLPTPDLVLAEPNANLNETPSVRSEGNTFLWENTNLPAIPDTLKSAESDGLNFSGPDSRHSGCDENDVGSLSARTRVVAQHFIKKSPAAKISNFQSGELSLNIILDGKTRKQCAWIFFETLVLKSNRLIDVHQDEAYGDITLSLNATILSEKL